MNIAPVLLAKIHMRQLPNVQTLYKHQGAELAACKRVLGQRDGQLQSMQLQIKQEHEEARETIASFEQQIAQLKGALRLMHIQQAPYPLI